MTRRQQAIANVIAGLEVRGKEYGFYRRVNGRLVRVPHDPVAMLMRSGIAEHPRGADGQPDSKRVTLSAIGKVLLDREEL